MREQEDDLAWSVADLLEVMGLGGYRDAFVSELSTGTRRLVELAMAIGHDADVLLLDEPSSGVAQREVEALVPLLQQICTDTGCAMVIVEHDIPLVSAMSDRLVAFEAGRVVVTGPPADVAGASAGHRVLPRSERGRGQPLGQQACAGWRSRPPSRCPVAHRGPAFRPAQGGPSVRRHPLVSRFGAASVVTVAITVALTGAMTGASAEAPPTLGPVVVGWWSAASLNPVVPPVIPPDVGPGDLYIAGANALPGGLEAAGPMAIAAMQFRLPEDAIAEELQLQLTGVQPPAVTLTACRALRAFLPAYAGAWAEAPTYDCADAGTARLAAGGTLFLDGVERLRRGRDLALVLIPGPLDRVVLAAPDARTLTVTAPAEPEASPRPSATPFAPAPAGALNGGGLAAVGAPPLVGGPLPTEVQPAVPSSAPAPVVPAAAPVAAAVTLPARPWPALLATLLLALLAFVPMVRSGGTAAAAQGERGVGRFRSERAGNVPHLT